MKNSKLATIATLLIASFSFIASCGGGDDDPQTPSGAVSVTVTPETLQVSPEAGSIDLKVEADADWAIRSDADWVSVSPSGGVKNQPSVIKVTYKANTSMDVRSAQINIVSGYKTVKSVTLTQSYVMQAVASETSLMAGGQASTVKFTVSANGEWTLSTEADWVKATPASGGKGETEVSLSLSENKGSDTREATLNLTCGESSTEIKVSQLGDAIVAPEGYTLVWGDEFNEGTTPGKDWVLENWAPGHVNNELQTYTSRMVDGRYTAEIKDGFLNITCFKAKDGKIYSARMNAKPATGWLYGYIEARINLPKGKGTWPAFWMMPSGVDWNTNPWPRCGEIDIMEEVGANPNYVSSSLHTKKYNHTIGTQITHEMYLAGAEGSFHVYALEWTEDEIITYVDGKVQLRASRAAMGADHDAWPFHYAFYPILNLAWGGDWGGYKGVDESALPAVMKVDYVRIFQKK